MQTAIYSMQDFRISSKTQIRNPSPAGLYCHMPVATDTLTTHITVILRWWETYQQSLLFLLHINQLGYTAGWWVHFSIWIRFSLYAVHVVLINQNSHHITILFLYCTLIYCCHSCLLHKDTATQLTDRVPTLFSPCMLTIPYQYHCH